MNGCLKVLIGFAIVGALGLGALVYFGVNFWNNTVAPNLQNLAQVQKQIERVLPDMNSLRVNFQSVNGRQTLRFEARVGFDPSTAPRAPQIANEILRIVQQQMPKELPLERLEVRLYREMGGGRQERTFSFDLNNPKPIPVPRGSS